ncbi:unnamed protein product [Nippostrongylus brasiliensis]|uniref:Serine/threonine-protein kinase dkf-1 (inferred by orthology to a C. elegans protein) n=1 Tax=Nippostrongylus brasiliensis TaxID=27835 RepID=A0A0N4Y0U3_NIPBR|nr:unnamed protein product [Nippostrongylus brasiliensis]
MLEKLRRQVRAFVNRLIPEWKEVFLFKQDDDASSGLMHVHSISLLSNGCTLEVVVLDPGEKPSRPHMLVPKTYMTPTFCNFCGALLTGLYRQGLHCKTCKCNYHRRCTRIARNNCLIALGSTLNPIPIEARGVELELPHNLVETSYALMTHCAICDKLLKGLVRQGLKCTDCGMNVHHACACHLPDNCVLSDRSIARMYEHSLVEDEPFHEFDSHHSPLYFIRR